MTQEDKELLLKDLCARLLYGVYVYANGMGCYKLSSIELYKGNVIIEINEERLSYHLYEIKPYLRPMSSMTKEEKEEYDALFYIHSDGETYCENWEWMDWMNAHHFDYRGLIPMGLALEAQKGMYEIVTTNI